MKKFFVRLWSLVKNLKILYGILLPFGFSFAVFKFDWLHKTITLTYWQLALVFISPCFIYYLIWVRYKVKKRKFKTGDLVTPLNEKHNVYVVYYYKRLFPSTVVCKMRGYNRELIVNEKYLTPYDESLDNSIAASLSRIANPISDAKITKL